MNAHPHARHAHSHPRVHKHAHHRKRFAYSARVLDEAHARDHETAQTAAPHAGAHTVRDSHLSAKSVDGDFTSISSNAAILHRQKMSDNYSTLYTGQLLSEGRLDSAMVWVKPGSGQRSVFEILADGQK